VEPKSKPLAKTRILIVDDHLLVREGLIRLLSREKDLEVCGEAVSEDEALVRVSELKPDLAIVDITLEDGNGLELTKSLRKRFPKLLILILSMHKEHLHADRALRLGANGYIMKREGKEKLLEAIRRVVAGHVYVSKAVTELMLQRIVTGTDDSDGSVRSLSDREFAVFRLIAEGYGTRQIAEELNISIKTAETHRERIREKLNLNTTFELVQQAIHWLHYEAR
jgi:two-component system, NarL family, response regulator FusR